MSYYGVSPSFQPRPHVWGMYSWHRNQAYGRRYYRYGEPPQHVIEQRQRAVNMARWLQHSRLTTIGDRTKPATWVSNAMNHHFRLLDAHGKPFGTRFHLVGQLREQRHGFRDVSEYLAQDQHGNQAWLRYNTRVRIVAQQEEDPHSRISRMLKAAFRSAE